MTVLALASGAAGWAVAFAAGMFSFLSPCVLPLVPGYLSLMSGVGASELAVATKTDTRQLLRATLLFVAGFTLVFTMLGATATAVGSVLNRHQLGLNKVSGAVIVLLGLFLAGLVNPRFLQQERRFHVSPSQLGALAPPVMGVAFAFGWTPCIGPVLAPILGFAADQSTVAKGIVLLLFYSLGLGVPFVASGVGFARLTGAFSWVKRHYRVINLVAGLLLVAFGVLLFTNNVGWLSGRISNLMDYLHLTRLTSS